MSEPDAAWREYTCNHRWRTIGFANLSDNHVCVLPKDHPEDEHVCTCGRKGTT